MILTCPSCSTRYLVAAESIGSSGRDVRCANCGHVWFESPPPAQALEEAMDLHVHMPDQEIPDIPIGSNLPAVISEGGSSSGVKVAFYLLLISTLLVAAFVFHKPILKQLPFMTSLYESFGLYETEGVVLTDVKVEKRDNPKNERYGVSCNIKNNSKAPAVVPVLMVTLLDKNDDVITSQPENTNAGKPLKPGEMIACDRLQIDLIGKSKDAVKLRLDIGSPFDIFLRN